MYSINVSFNDYKGKAQRKTLNFNLDEREVLKMLPELKALFDWLEDNKNAAETRELDLSEVRDFYNQLEAVMLEAYGEPSEDGLYFRKSGRFEFEESKMFDACMMMFVDDTKEAVKLLEGLLPAKMFERVKNADASDIAAASEAKAIGLQEEVERLRAQVAEQNKNPSS